VLPPASGKETRPEGLCDRLLYDALSRTVECDSASLQLVLQNTLKFIEIVHNSNYSQEAMTCSYTFLSIVAYIDIQHRDRTAAGTTLETDDGWDNTRS